MQDTILSVAQWISGTSLSQFIQNDPNAFPMLEVFHIIALALVIGPIILLDLRLIGASSDRSLSTKRIMGFIVPIVGSAFAVALVTGIGLFISQPERYVQTPVFWVKMGLLMLAGLNMLVFHLWLEKSQYDLDQQGKLAGRVRLAGLSSILFWISVLFAGRFIGFLLAF